SAWVRPPSRRWLCFHEHSVRGRPRGTTFPVPPGPSRYRGGEPARGQGVGAVRRDTSQIRTVVSWLPVASHLPSGEKSAHQTVSVCPRRWALTLPVATSHSRGVSLSETTVLPSGDRAK